MTPEQIELLIRTLTDQVRDMDGMDVAELFEIDDEDEIDAIRRVCRTARVTLTFEDASHD